MNRRGFIFGLAGLAAAAVAGQTLQALTPTDRERLDAAIKSGRVENQTFDLRGTGEGVTLVGISGLLMRNCDFLLDPGVTRLRLERCNGLWLYQCRFVS